MTHFADRLSAALRQKKNALCVGLDPRWESLPTAIKQRHGGATLDNVALAFEEFCARVLDVVAPLVPAVKPQSAFFEACGPAGLAVLQRLLNKARTLGLITIWDGKRNDIASTASAYADAAFDGSLIDGVRRPVWNADALTVNPYLGRESLEPFLKSARRDGRGVFALVRTSNPGAGQFQDLTCDGRPLFLHVAEAVAAWAHENPGACGFGDIGAVVGATRPEELAQVRELVPDVWFLIPGYGAQGGAAQDTAAAFRDDGLGAVVNSARAILYPCPPEEPRWEQKVEEAARQAIAELVAATPMKHLK